MSRQIYTESIQSPGALTPEQAARVRTALRAAAGEFAEPLELSLEELEERVTPGLNSTN